MWVYQHRWLTDDGPTAWVPLTSMSSRDLLQSLDLSANGNSEPCSGSPNGGASDADVDDQIRIILFAREMGWL